MLRGDNYHTRRRIANKLSFYGPETRRKTGVYKKTAIVLFASRCPHICAVQISESCRRGADYVAPRQLN